ncbi:GNAT family N-acetyltransferase [Candidatus Micrarchaeota archaeon]|nr:GNAT family N-acetyltransferase [Candidatus Micrarchaeota archaeon]
MSLKIEHAKFNDLDALHRIERECFTSEAFTKEHIAYLLESPNAVSLVAEANHEIVGFIVGMIENYGRTTVGHVYTIDVAFKHRRAGVGLRLLDELEHIFLERGVKTSYLEVRIDNKAARELYRKKGYTELEPLENFYAKGRHGLRMKKELKK